VWCAEPLALIYQRRVNARPRPKALDRIVVFSGAMRAVGGISPGESYTVRDPFALVRETERHAQLFGRGKAFIDCAEFGAPAGRVEHLVCEGGEIAAYVEWSPRALKHFAAREFPFLAFVANCDRQGGITRILSISLEPVAPRSVRGTLSAV
jgi:hypothetical protein